MFVHWIRIEEAKGVACIHMVSGQLNNLHLVILLNLNYYSLPSDPFSYKLPKNFQLHCYIPITTTTVFIYSIQTLSHSDLMLLRALSLRPRIAPFIYCLAQHTVFSLISVAVIARIPLFDRRFFSYLWLLSFLLYALGSFWYRSYVAGFFSCFSSRWVRISEWPGAQARLSRLLLSVVDSDILHGYECLTMMQIASKSELNFWIGVFCN